MSRYRSYDDYESFEEKVTPPNKEAVTVPKPMEGKVANTPLLRVRKTPDRNGEVVEILSKGDLVTVVDTIGDFHKIHFYGSHAEEGYILSKFFEEE